MFGGTVDVVAVLPALDVENATIRFAEGASRRPVAMEGVGKWLAGAPMLACFETAPVDGLSP